ncbi:MAG: histidine phosphatase family protein [Pseudomonadota bacterium]
MFALQPCDLVFVRHAPADTGGRLCGRRDVPALLDDTAALARLSQALGTARQVVSSPAQRCVQTARRVLPDHPLGEDARLWEQDFGDHDGMPLAALPDLGPLSRANLSRYAAPNGESFAAMVGRVRPALDELALRTVQDGPVVVFAHAGTARAALSCALDDESAGLAFEIAPLSMTVLRCFSGGVSVAVVNREP